MMINKSFLFYSIKEFNYFTCFFQRVMERNALNWAIFLLKNCSTHIQIRTPVAV